MNKPPTSKEFQPVRQPATAQPVQTTASYPAPNPRPRMPTIPPGAAMQEGAVSHIPAQSAVPMTSAASHHPPSNPPVALPTGPIDASWQRIWLRAQGRDWVSLALIGSSPRAPEATMRVAGMLARISEELGHPLVIIDARTTELRTMANVQARMRSLAARGTRCIAVVQYPHYNPVTVPIAQAADASMMCVFVAESRLANSRQTIEQVGRDRFLGTVILRHS